MSILCSMVGATFGVAAAAEVIRLKKSIIANGNAQIDTAQSKFGGASALFDGTGDGLSIEHSGDMRFGTGDFTMEFWYRPAGRAQSYPLIFSNRTGFTSGNIVFHDRHNSVSTKLTIWIYNLSTSSPIFTSTTTTVDGTWYHVALSRSGTSLKMFINGTQEGSTYTTSADIDIGAGTSPYSVSYPGASSEFYGWVDEIRVSKSARYTTNFTPSTTPFVNDDNTLLLIHANGTDGSTFFEDDNGVRASIGITGVNQTKISTAQSQFSGASIEFDGTDDHLTLSTFPTTTGDLTYELWGRFDILPWNQTLGGGNFMQIAYAGSGDYLIINRSGSSGSQVLLQVATGNRYGSFTKSGVNLAINTWYHIAFVRTSGVWKAFFNGTELTTFINDSNFTNSGRTENVAYTQIGKFGDSRGSWDGYMDEIRFSNSARYTADFTPPTAPFVNDANTLLLMHCDGTDGSTVFRDDNGARAPKGITAVGNAQIDTAQSKFGGSSALFDGTGDYLIVQSNPLPTSGSFTVEFWIRFSSIGTLRPIWSNRDTGGTNRGVLYVNASGGLTWWNASDNLNFGSNLSANTWYHIACVKDGSTRRLFVDGGGMVTDSGAYTAGDLFQIGRADYTSTAFTSEIAGHIDEFRVSNTARYTANFTAPTAPFQNDKNTILLLHMDGTDGSTVFFDDNGRDTTPTA